MNPEETMVENDFENEAADDALPEGVIEEEDESEETLDSFVEEEEQPDDDPEPKEEAPKATEPGWIKRRVEKAVTKAIAETEARMQAMFDQQMAPIREKMLEDEAQELVRSRKVGDIETARELVRLRSGMPAAKAESAGQTPRPRGANGQFVSRESQDDPATVKQIAMLRHQADRIRQAGGPDVIAEFNRNSDVRNKIVSGEMDFYDVAEQMRSAGGKRKPPAPVRSSNGASGSNPNAIETMSDEAFARLEKRIQGGARIRMS